jgi:HD-GYP domain-containing protein (c-di-GMP phosphodiesterase class II)
MRLSLTTRGFLCSFLALSAALAAGYLMVSEAIRLHVRETLKQSLYEQQEALDRQAAASNRDLMRTVSALAETSGLKAAISLSREIGNGPARADAESRVEARSTIQAQLLEMARLTGLSFLAVAGPDGAPVAATEKVTADLGHCSLCQVGGHLYETLSVPVNQGPENLGSLILGRRFSLPRDTSGSRGALLHDGTVVETTLPAAINLAACSGPAACVVEIADDHWLALPIRKFSPGDGYELFSLQPLDAKTREFTRAAAGNFVLVGFAALAITCLFSVWISRSVVRPLHALIEQLKETERQGRLPQTFNTESTTTEVHLLASAINRAARAVHDANEHLDSAYLEFIETMARALDARDRYTAGHSDRVSEYSVAIARALNCPPGQIEILRVGARLHDIGKIGVPDAVLQKPGRLTDEEFALIKQHPEIGRRILENVSRFQDYLPIIELHHEDFDGRGYPHGLRGEETPLLARIVHVADAYDAMTSNRAYRSRLSEARVHEILRECAGTQFDAAIVDAFLRILEARNVELQYQSQPA